MDVRRTHLCTARQSWGFTAHMPAADLWVPLHQHTPCSQVTPCSRLAVTTPMLCNHKTLQSLCSDHTLLPAAVFAGNRSHCRAGPGDPRKPQALWLGTDSGWGNGRRRAVLLASRKYPELLVSFSDCISSI